MRDSRRKKKPGYQHGRVEATHRAVWLEYERKDPSGITYRNSRRVVITEKQYQSLLNKKIVNK